MAVQSGLREVVAGRTHLSLVDGMNGRLSYRGIDIRALAGSSSFEEVVHLLWYGTLPGRTGLENFRRLLAAARALPPEILEIVRRASRGANPMDALRTAVSALAHEDPEVDDRSEAANLRKAERILSGAATAIGAFERFRRGHPLPDPDAALGHAANLLFLLHGKRPDPLHERALDACLVMHAEHSFNASTFAARIAASTLSDLHAAIVAGIATLKGPLHGGANREVMQVLEEIGAPGNVEAWAKRAATEGRRFPGFGHAVYRVDDPRAETLRLLSKELAEEGGDPRWYEISVSLERAVKRTKPLPVNVDFYSATVYRYLGIPTDLFPAMFAAARIAGWAAHVFEQWADNRLIRPEAEYVGPIDQPYVPLDRRPS